MSLRTDWTPEKRQEFLDNLRMTGNVTKAAQAAQRSRSMAYKLKGDDPEFAAAWKDAEEEACDLLEAEARRRAFDGVDEPVGWYQGEAGGTVKRYSDTLMIFLLKGHRPEKYADRRKVEHSVDESLADRLLKAQARVDKHGDGK